jgi:hypothetical protein
VDLLLFLVAFVTTRVSMITLIILDSGGLLQRVSLVLTLQGAETCRIILVILIIPYMINIKAFLFDASRIK